MELVAEVPGALVGDVDGDIVRVGGERSGQTVRLSTGEAFPARIQNVPDAVEGVSRAAAVTKGLLLDASADVIDRGTGEPTTWTASST